MTFALILLLLIIQQFWEISIKFPLNVISFYLIPHSINLYTTLFYFISLFFIIIATRYFMFKYILSKTGILPFEYFNKVKIMQLRQKFNNYIILAILLMFFFIYVTSVFIAENFKEDLPYSFNLENNEYEYNLINDNIDTIGPVVCESLEGLKSFVLNDTLMCSLKVTYKVNNKYNISRIRISYRNPSPNLLYNINTSRTDNTMESKGIIYPFNARLKEEGIYPFYFNFYMWDKNKSEEKIVYSKEINFNIISRTDYIGQLDAKEDQKLPLILTLFSLVFVSVFSGVKSLRDLIEIKK